MHCFFKKLLTYSNKVINSIINHYFFLHEKHKKYAPTRLPCRFLLRLHAASSAAAVLRHRLTLVLSPCTSAI
jgi:hypothetical protein